MSVGYSKITCPVCGSPSQIYIDYDYDLGLCNKKPFIEGEYGTLTLECVICGQKVESFFSSGNKKSSHSHPKFLKSVVISTNEFLRTKNLTKSAVKRLPKCIKSKSVGILKIN